MKVKQPTILKTPPLNALPQPAMPQGYVLVVEPTTDTRIRITKAFQQLAMRVVAVGCGCDALDIIKGMTRPSLAIVELSLPDMSGLEFIKKFSKLRSCPVIITTYENNPALAADLLNLVADDVLRKPFDERELTARAYRIMQPHVSHQSLVMRHDSSVLRQSPQRMTHD